MKTTIARLAQASIMTLLVGTASAADTTLIYKSIDADGTTVFTDQPAPQAVVVTPPPLNVMDRQPASVSPRTAARPIGNIDDTLDSVTIVTPAHEETFIDPQSDLWVEFDLSPSDTLPVGLAAQVLLDGSAVSTGNSNRLSIGTPERGTHTVQIQITSPTGAVVTESDIIEIHVRHHVAGSAN